MEKGSVQRLQSTALLHILQLYEKVRQRQRMQKLRFLLAVCEIRVAIALGTMIGLLGRHPCAKKALHQTIEESVRIWSASSRRLEMNEPILVTPVRILAVRLENKSSSPR